MASDTCINAISVTLNESIVLLGHDSNFQSDDTFDLIILFANLFIYECKIPKNIPEFHFLKRYLKTAFEAVVNMSHDEFVIDWYFYKDLMDA